MSPDVPLHLFAQLMWKAIAISAPLLLTVLLVGLAVSIFQVATQIQELSLTFIPKLLASVAVLILAGPWMLRQLMAYGSALLRGIPWLV